MVFSVLAEFRQGRSARSARGGDTYTDSPQEPSFFSPSPRNPDEDTAVDEWAWIRETEIRRAAHFGASVLRHNTAHLAAETLSSSTHGSSRS